MHAGVEAYRVSTVVRQWVNLCRSVFLFNRASSGLQPKYRAKYTLFLKIETGGQ